MTIADVLQIHFNFTGKLLEVTTVDGKRLSILNPNPGYGGFGNNSPETHVLIGGNKYLLIDPRSSQALKYYEVVAVD
jgi:hypothetical protein